MYFGFTILEKIYVSESKFWKPFQNLEVTLKSISEVIFDLKMTSEIFILIFFFIFGNNYYRRYSQI